MKHQEEHIKNCIQYEYLNDHIIASLYEDVKKANDFDDLKELMFKHDEEFFWDCIINEEALPEIFESFIRNILSFRLEYSSELYDLLEQEIRDNE